MSREHTAGPIAGATSAPAEPRAAGEAEQPVRLTNGEMVLELGEEGVTVSGQIVPLAPRGLALLRVLAAAETVVSRRELRSCLKDGSDDHALEVAISRLRRSLAVPGLITAVDRRGYRLNADRIR